MKTASTIDEALRTDRKALRTLPGKLLLGSTGARLWADYLEPRPGFAGRLDFIHKMNLPLLFQVDCDASTSWEPCRSEWLPSHLRVVYERRSLRCEEHKWISWDDCAVSSQTWSNQGTEETVLRLAVPDDFAVEAHPSRWNGGWTVPHYSFDIEAVIAASDPALGEGIRLGPGEQATFVIAAALGIRGQDPAWVLAERAAGWAAGSPQASLLRQQEEYEQWFAKAPAFRSSDPVLDQTWKYRWFILRHNLADPKYGKLMSPLFYEGRSHKKGKEPFGGGGWEFSKLVNLSVPLHLLDARWYEDPASAEGALFNMQAHRGEEGIFSCLTVDQVMHDFAHFACWAMYQLYLVHRNEDAVRKLLPALKQEIAAWERKYGTADDALMIEHWHTRTGKEYQPSYWYFHDYPDNPKDRSTYTPVKRVDRTIYHYLNALGVARLCRALDDAEAEHYEQRAEAVKRDVLDNMWDEEVKFFFDLHPQTNEKALVKNIVGFYPAWAGMVDERHDGLLDHLFAEQAFATGAPFPTVAADCPLYTSEGGWKGRFIKGRNGCMWNGPAWPYTTGIVLDALARESRRNGHRHDEAFGDYLREYSFLHFQQRDLRQPALVEHYSSRSGEPLSDEPEYNHSHYLDLIVSHVAGLELREKMLIVDPLDIGLDYFALQGVKAAGLKIDITYCRPLSVPRPGLAPGLAVYINDTLIHHSERLQRFEWSLQGPNMEKE